VYSYMTRATSLLSCGSNAPLALSARAIERASAIIVISLAVVVPSPRRSGTDCSKAGSGNGRRRRSYSMLVLLVLCNSSPTSAGAKRSTCQFDGRLSIGFGVIGDLCT